MVKEHILTHTHTHARTCARACTPKTQKEANIVEHMLTLHQYHACKNSLLSINGIILITTEF